MPDELKRTQKALSKAYPRTVEGQFHFVHAQLYFKYIPLYIYHMREGINSFLAEPMENVRPAGGKYDQVEELVKVMVNHTGAGAADPETNVYHAKVLRLEDAEQFFELKDDLDLGELPKTIIPYEQARRVLIENPENIAVIDCVCRTLSGDKACGPLDVCLMIGDPWVDWIMERVPEMHPRRISQDEALKILRECHERGWVHAGFFKDAAAGRMYHICNCCPCCCTALKAQNYVGAPMFGGSGFVAEINAGKCVKCGKCAETCNFLAITQNDGDLPVVDESLCKGCQACTTACPANAISLRPLEKDVLAPLDISALKK